MAARFGAFRQGTPGIAIRSVHIFLFHPEDITMKKAIFVAVAAAMFATAAVACDPSSSRSTGGSSSSVTSGMLMSLHSAQSASSSGSRQSEHAAHQISAHTLAASRAPGTRCTTEMNGNRSITYCESASMSSGASLSGTSMKAAVK